MIEYTDPRGISPEGRARLDKYGSTLDDANVRQVIDRIADYPEIMEAVDRHRLGMPQRQHIPEDGGIRIEIKTQWAVRFDDGDVEDVDSREHAERYIVEAEREIEAGVYDPEDYAGMCVVSRQRTVTTTPWRVPPLVCPECGHEAHYALRCGNGDCECVSFHRALGGGQ